MTFFFGGGLQWLERDLDNPFSCIDFVTGTNEFKRESGLFFIHVLTLLSSDHFVNHIMEVSYCTSRFGATIWRNLHSLLFGVYCAISEIHTCMI